MKKIFFFTLLILSSSVKAVEVSQSLLDAIQAVESNGNERAIGDNGKAVGAFQIHKIYVDDVNSFSSEKFTYEDRNDKEKSQKIVKLYLEHYGKNYEKKTGKKATNEVLARIHNGGPKGHNKEATKNYWKKVENNLK